MEKESESNDEEEELLRLIERELYAETNSQSLVDVQRLLNENRQTQEQISNHLNELERLRNSADSRLTILNELYRLLDADESSQSEHLPSQGEIMSILRKFTRFSASRKLAKTGEDGQILIKPGSPPMRHQLATLEGWKKRRVDPALFFPPFFAAGSNQLPTTETETASTRLQYVLDNPHAIANRSDTKRLFYNSWLFSKSLHWRKFEIERLLNETKIELQRFLISSHLTLMRQSQLRQEEIKSTCDSAVQPVEVLLEVEQLEQTFENSSLEISKLGNMDLKELLLQLKADESKLNAFMENYQIWERIKRQIGDRTLFEVRETFRGFFIREISHAIEAFQSIELERLKRLVQASSNGNIDWTLIASQLGTNRLPADCLKAYLKMTATAASSEDGTSWTKEEDETLLRVVDKCGPGNWAFISDSYLPNKSSKQVLTRFSKSLDPLINRKRWTAAEDQILIDSVNNTSVSSESTSDDVICWTEVARSVPQRTDVQCRERYRKHLDPKLCGRPFTTEEDKLLLTISNSEKGKISWKNFLSQFPNRSAFELQKRLAALRKTEKQQLEADRISFITSAVTAAGSSSNVTGHSSLTSQ